MAFHVNSWRIDRVRWGWHAVGCSFAAFSAIGNSLYSFDPLSNSARAIANMGIVADYLIALQLIAGTFLVGQIFSVAMRRWRLAFVPWMVLAVCSLMRFAGSALSGTDSTFQTPIYLVSIGLFVLGAANAGRTL
mgnify:FL=1